MSLMCYICNKSYANKASLASHKSRYHKEKDKILNNPPALDEYDEITRKRYHSNDDLREQSESESVGSFKRTKTEESHNMIIPKLINVVSGLVKDMDQVSNKVDKLTKGIKQVPILFDKVARDMDKVEDKIDINKQNINGGIMFKQMDGSGMDKKIKQFYQKIIDQNPNVIEDVINTRKTVEAIEEHTFFKEFLKEDKKLKREVMEIEECFINSMEIRMLFNGDVEDIQFKIKELQNAAKVAKAILELSEEEKLILNTIIHSSKIKVMNLLDEWFYHIKPIFNRLPSDADLKYTATEIMKEYKSAKGNVGDNESNGDADDESSETLDMENDQNNSQESEESVSSSDKDSEGGNVSDEDSLNENKKDKESDSDDEKSSQTVKSIDDRDSDKSDNDQSTNENKDVDSV